MNEGKEGKKEEASSGLPVFAPLFFAQAMIGDCNGDARLGSCRKSDPRARDDDPSDDLVGKFVFYKKVVCKKVVLDRPKNTKITSTSTRKFLKVELNS